MKYKVFCSSSPKDESDSGYFCGDFDGVEYDSREEAEEVLRKAKEEHDDITIAWIKEV